MKSFAKFPAFLHDCIISVAGHEQHWQFRCDSVQRRGKLPSVQLRHHHVGEQKVELRGALGKAAEGVFSVHCTRDVVTGRYQHAEDRLANGRVVFHQ